MADESMRGDAAAAMHRINQTWLDGRVDDLASMVHPEIIMVVPGFAARVKGREAFLSGFRDFCQNARIQEFNTHEDQIDTAGDTAVATFRYDMVYERSGERYHATGRDLWVLQRQNGLWIAVWRAMLEMEENTHNTRQ